MWGAVPTMCNLLTTLQSFICLKWYMLALCLILILHCYGSMRLYIVLDCGYCDVVSWF